jgi:RNA polymerase sigma-70 factor (ECF subfamily)
MTSSPPRDSDSADPALTGRFYDELHRIAERLFASERSGHTLQPTALVNEACVRLMTSSRLPELPREQRLALAARVLRQVLVDNARTKGAAKRGASGQRIELDPELSSAERTEVDLDAIQSALERLTALHPRQAEVVTLRIFGGLDMEQVASVVGASKRTVEGDWTVARAWLRRELSA